MGDNVTVSGGGGIRFLDRIDDIFLFPAMCMFFCVIWMLFLSFYHTRVWGFIITKIINRFVREGYVHIGSISFSVLSGKLMFRDVAFITPDFSVRVQDGLLIFRWWRRFHPLKELQEISPHELVTRLNITLFGFEYHCFNRSSLYNNIQKAFGMEPTLIPESSSFASSGSGGLAGGSTTSGTASAEKASVTKDQSFVSSTLPSTGASGMGTAATGGPGTTGTGSSRGTGGTGTGTSGTASSGTSQMSGKGDGFSWRDFFSVIKVEIYSGRFVFGNHLTPSVLIISMEDAHAVYTTLATQTPYDCYTHEVKCDGEGLKVMFAPSPKYEGVVDEPPRYMGEGFAVVQTNTVYMHYYQDEAGIVPMGIDGNAEDLPPPYWALDVTCGKGTHVSYGPWADRQRDALQKFFFPQEYKTHDISPKPAPGDKREFSSLNFRLNILAEATIDILFTKNKETNAVHIDIGAGSYVEVSTPLVVGPDGFDSKITGQLLHVESSTSLEYRSFVESETLQFEVVVHYPRRWNHHQNWEVTLTFSKATWYLIFMHKIFISDLISDWSSKSRQDLYSFVPYTMHVNIILKEFELILPGNEYNWIDCSSQHQQNVFIAFVGQELDLSVVLPFSDFLAETVPVRVLLRADCISGLLHIPECFSARSCLEGLDRSAKASSNWTEDKGLLGLTKPCWQKHTTGDSWTECAGTPHLVVSVIYTYHPVPLDEDVPTVLIKKTSTGTGTSHTFLGPKSSYGGWMKSSGLPIPSELTPDTLHVEVDIGPAVIMAYGTVVKCVLALKENYLGMHDKITDFFDSPSSMPSDFEEGPKEYLLNAMSLRPLQVTASLNVEGLKAYLPMYCGDAETGCPIAMLEQLCFELNKGYKETTLQLLLSPVTILVSDALERPAQESHLNAGHLGLSGLQLRAHAMFSDEGLPIDSITLEYAWLIEVQIGVISGKLTPPQVLSIVNFLQLFIHLAVDPLDDLTAPCTSDLCVHQLPQMICRVKEPCYPKLCPTEDDLKYRMLRVSVKNVELLLVESGCATRIEVDLVRVATCNLHSQMVDDGVTLAIEKVKVHQYVAHQMERRNRPKSDEENVPPWLECGSVSFGPIHVDSACFLERKIMHKAQAFFIKVHDRRSQRLWFLWPGAGPLREEQTDARCGCLGGCLFFTSKSTNRQFLNLASSPSGRATGLSSFHDTENDYGRSILQKGQWVFAVCDRTPVESPSKEFKFTNAFVGYTSPTQIGEVQPAQVDMETVAQGPNQDERIQVDSSSTPSEHESQVLAQAQTESASTVVASLASEPTIVDRRGSSITVGSVPTASRSGHSPWVGSCHSLPVETMKQWGSSGTMTHSRNMSADTVKYPQMEYSVQTASAYGSQLTASPDTDFDTPDSMIPTIHAYHADSLSSGSVADSEYFSAEDDDFSPNMTGSKFSPSPPQSIHGTKVTQYSPSPPQSIESPQSPVSQGTIGTLSSFSSQTVESPDKAPPISKPPIKSSSSPSYMSAASSEEALAQMLDAKHHPAYRENIMQCNTAPYRNLVTRTSCESWVTPAPVHPPFNAQDSPSVVLNKGNIQLPQFTLLRQGLCPGMVSFHGMDTLKWEAGSDDSDALLSDNEAETDGRPTSWEEEMPFEQSGTGGSKFDNVSSNKATSETSCLVKVQGTVQVFVTPMLLEASTRFVDVLESMLSRQRPEAVIDVLHTKCVSDVEGSCKNSIVHNAANTDTDYRKGGIKESTVTIDIAIPKISMLFLQAGRNLSVGNHSKPVGRNPSLLIACVRSLQTQVLLKTITPLIPILTNASLLGSNRPRSSMEQLDQLDPGDPNQVQSSVLARIQANRIHCQLRSLPETSKKQESHRLAVTAIVEPQTRVMFNVEQYVDQYQDAEEGIPSEAVVSPGWILMEWGVEETQTSFCHQTSRKWKLNKLMQDTSPTVCSLKTPSQEKIIPPACPDITVTDTQKVRQTRSSQSVMQDGPEDPDLWPSTSASGKGSRSGLSMSPKRHGKTTDGSATIKTVWFHIPAPKRSSEKELPPDMCNINVLSAAVPTVDAWLESADSFSRHVTQAANATHNRLCAIMACILADAHDNAHAQIVPPKGRYDRWGIVTKAVQQDLSCQLMYTLWHYLKKTDWHHIERLISYHNLPDIQVLEQGVHTLVRQWKVNLSLINPEMATAVTSWRTDQPKQVPAARQSKEEAHMPDVEFKITKKDRSQLTGTGHSDDMDAVQQIYTSRYGTGYSMYDEFSGRPKPNVSRTTSLLDRPSSSLERGTYLSPEDVVPEVRVRSHTEGSIGTSGTIRTSLKDGAEREKIDSLDSQRLPRKSLESLDTLLDQDGDDRVKGDGLYSGYRRLKPGSSQEGSSRIGQTQTTKPRASVVVATTSATQLGDADVLFKSLLKYLGITKKPPKPLKFAKKFGEVSATFHLNQLKVNIAEISSKSSRSKEKRAKRESSGRLSSTFPAFSCEDIGFKVSVKEANPNHGNMEHKTSPTEMKGSIAAGLEKKNEMTGMAICISAHCGKIMQVIEMPFLRVASQLAGVAKMIQLQQSNGIDNIKVNHVHMDSPGSLDNENAINGIQIGMDTPDGSPLGGQGSVNIDACSASIGSSQDEGLPKCWQTMYHLINLYSGVAEPVSIDTTRVFMNPVFNVENELQGRTVMGQTTVDGPGNGSDAGTDEADSAGGDGSEYGDRGDIQVSILGSVTLGELCIMGQLAGIQVEAEVSQVAASFNNRQSLTKTGKHFGKIFVETTSAVSCEEVLVVISEKSSQSNVPIVTLKIEKPQASSAEEARDILRKLSITAGIGGIDLSIPLSPAKLHSIVIHSSKKFATRMAQLQVWYEKQKPDDVDNSQTAPAFGDTPQPAQPQPPVPPLSTEDLLESQELHLSAALKLKRICLQSTLVATLKVQYLIQEITACITPGEPVRFAVTMPNHSLKFSSQLNIGDHSSAPEIKLPSMHLSGQFTAVHTGEKGSSIGELRRVSLLETTAELEAFKHSVSTDLVNHLITVQKVLIQDLSQMVDELVATKEAASREFSLPANDSTLIFSLQARMKGIQITATTPSACAVRLETGLVDFEVSNKPRYTNTGAKKKGVKGMSKSKLFAKAHIDLNICLGTLVRNPMFAEIEPELHQLAYFKTRIALRNALKDEMSSSQGDKEAFLIALTRPILYVQPTAVDKAVLVWLCYQTAYDQWFEQQATLLQQETRGSVILTRHPLPRQPSVVSPTSSSIFLQLTLEELGICLPINPAFQNVSSTGGSAPEPDYHSSLVLTLESSQITACYSNALVSRGSFQTFCLRFAEDFTTSLDDWRPESYESLMNACVVPQGTYEVCSKTTSPERTDGGQLLAGKWLLNFLWRMEGFDVQADPSIGHQLSALANTLTSLAGNDEDIADLNSVMDSQEESTIQPNLQETPATARLKRPTSLYVTKQESKRQTKLIMQEMNEQAKVVSDLRTLGAKSVTIAEETERLRQLEAAVFNDFRRDIRKKLKMQGVKASLRDKLVGQKPLTRHARSSTIVSGDFRTPPKQGRKQYMYAHDQDVPTTPPSPAEWGRARSLTTDSPHPSHVTFNIPPGNTPSPIMEAPYYFGGTDPRATPPLYRGAFHDLNASVNDPTNISRELESVQMRRRRMLLRSATISGATDSGSENSDHEIETMTYTPPLRKKSWLSSTTDDTMSTGSTSTLHGRHLETSGDQASISPAHSIKIDQTLDLELDIKFKIDSGKLVFHCHGNKQAQMEQDANLVGEKKKDGRRSLEEVIFGRSKIMRTPGSASSLGGGAKKPGEVVSSPTQSVFYLPAVDVKTHYLSTSTQGSSNTADSGSETLSGKSQSDSSANESSSEAQRNQKAKQAVVYTWAMFTTSAKEIVVAPAFLDFLEQALESVPTSLPGFNSAASDEAEESNSNYDMEISANSLVSSSTMDVSTFPVDVVVYVCVQPSVICFSCLPTSKVECLLRLPSFELAFSSKGSSQEHVAEGGTSAEVQQGLRHMRHTSGGASIPSDLASLSASNDPVPIGLSIAIVLSDFSLFVFHPYGGHQKRERLMEEVGSFTGDADSDGEWSLPSRKDALSLKVEFVNMTLSRSRKVIGNSDTDSGGGGGEDTAGHSTTSSSSSRNSQNVSQFSIVCDMGSASFKYDMRRLTELLAFPKAWYRKKIVRRLFLGDEGTQMPSEEELSSDVSSSSSSDTENEMPPTWTQHSARKAAQQPQHRTKTGFPYTPPSPSLFSEYSQHSPSTPTTPSLSEVLKAGKAGSAASRGSHATSSSSGLGKSFSDSSATNRSGHPKLIDIQPSLSTGTTSSVKSPSWQTLVFVAVNFSKLDINMNMSNVMGTTVFSTDMLQTQGYISIDSNSCRDFSLSTTLKQSSLESKGGVIGGHVQIKDLKSTIHQSSHSLQEPQHELGVKLGDLTSRIDYMGSSILMLHLTNLDTTCRDEWKIPATIGQTQLPFSVSRSTSVYVNGTLQWDQVQLMICRTTTPDLIKVVTRLEEFFSQQFQSSKQMLSSWQSMTPATRRADTSANTSSRTTSDSGSQSDLGDRNQYRHWQPVFELVAKVQSHIPSPRISQDGGMTLGGHFMMKGKRALLACFHGINFRASSWVLFTLREPEIQVETEALEIQPGPSDSGDMIIIQDLLFSLGHNQTQREEGSMGIIYRVTRNDRSHFPTASSVDECFQYACAIRAPEEFNQYLAGGMPVGGIRSSLSRHAAEPIFALPKLQMEMRSKHQQSLRTPFPEGGPHPVVSVTFVTHFTDHIHVSMDIELILFLHDLVTHYISYKEKALAPSRSNTRVPPKPVELEASAGEVNPSVGERDRREFQCTTWQLEPTVRLLSWGGKQIEPVGVDYILQKLGFKHARVTIPKWIQRGAMDPVDKVIAFTVHKLIRVLKDGDSKLKMF